MSPPCAPARTPARSTGAAPEVAEVRHPGLRKRMREIAAANSRAKASRVDVEPATRKRPREASSSGGGGGKRGRMPPPTASRPKRSLAEATADMVAESAARRARVMRTHAHDGILSTQFSFSLSL